ncbi:unnamed protein product [Tenebrio molitor]|nr:unnamed protein product [Tenebrio molitor]
MGLITHLELPGSLRSHCAVSGVRSAGQTKIDDVWWNPWDTADLLRLNFYTVLPIRDSH